jgi:hypothetical protein
MACEYGTTARRGEYIGVICVLTNRACYADQDNPIGHTKCIRRTWANQYALKIKPAAETAPRSSD